MKAKSIILRLLLIFSFILIFEDYNFATVPINDADYLIITHPQLEAQAWKDNLIALFEDRGFQVGWRLLEDLSQTNEDIKAFITGLRSM